MSAPDGNGPIGDRDVDRLLALVPPPPRPPADLADRILAKAIATPQVPPLPPRRARRTGKRRIGRRATIGAVLGSFLLTIAAAAAVLGGHVDFHRLAAIPAALFGKHAVDAPVRSAAPAPSANGRPIRPITAGPALAKPPITVEPRQPATPAILAPGAERRLADRPLLRPARPAPVARRPDGPGRRAALQRELVDHGHVKGIDDRRGQRRGEDSGRPSAVEKAPRSSPGMDDAASANRESLRASERPATPEAGSMGSQREAAGSGLDGRGGRWRNGRRWNDQRFGGQGQSGWRRRGRGQGAGWREQGMASSSSPGSADSAGTSNRTEERAGPKAVDGQGTRRDNGRRGNRPRQRRR